MTKCVALYGGSLRHTGLPETSGCLFVRECRRKSRSEQWIIPRIGARQRTSVPLNARPIQPLPMKMLFNGRVIPKRAVTVETVSRGEQTMATPALN